MDDSTTPVQIAVELAEPVRVFEVALRGYRREEVDAYVRQAEAELAELRFAVEEAAAAPGRAELVALREQVAAEQASFTPSFTALGERAELILRLAQEEADDLVHATERETRHARERAMRECDDLRRRALAAAGVAEQKGQSALLAARAEAGRLAEQSRADGAARRAAAEDEATGVVNTARITAEDLLNAARTEADTLTAAARAEVAALSRERADLMAQLGMLAERMQALAHPVPRAGEPTPIRTA